MLYLNILELHGAQLVVLKAPKEYIWKTQKRLFPEIITLSAR